ncbi:MAG: ABC transporter permease subunit [Planctomycetota bacterium]|nr:ABC transporter permease subunit [Planctomycetota bacterium]
MAHPLRSLAAAFVFALHAAVILLSLAGPFLLFAGTFHDGGLDPSPWANVYGSRGLLERWTTLIGATAEVTVVALAVSLVLGTALGALLLRTDSFLRGPLLALVLFALALPFYVTSACFIAIFDLKFLEESTLAVGLIHGVAHLPMSLLVIGLAQRTVRRELEETALVEGAGPLRTFLHVTLRGSVAGLAAAAVLVALWVATDYSASDVLRVRTFSREVYTLFALHGSPREATLVAVPQVVVFSLLFSLLARSYFHGNWSLGSFENSLTFRLGRWRLPSSVATAALCLSLVAAPLVFLMDKLETSKGLGHYVRALAPAIQTSVWTSLSAGAICAFLAVGIAWTIVRRRFFHRLLTAYVVLLLAFPAPLVGVGLIQIFNRPGLLGDLYDLPLMLVLGYCVRFLPLAVVLLVPWVRSIPREFEDAARLEGATTFDVWRRVVLPLSLPGAFVAFFVVTALSLGELPCSSLVSPPGYETVGKRFFSFIHYGIYGEAAALCLLSLVGALVPWLGLVLVLRKGLFRS